MTRKLVSARGAPYLKINGNLSLPENLVTTSAYERLSTQTLGIRVKNPVG